MSHHIVAAKNLGYSYAPGARAIVDVSFRITHGESVAVVGENGAGKSTLLLHLNGYLLAQKGELVVGDHVVTKRSLKEVHRTVGMVFQEPDDQLFMPTVYDDVAFGPINFGLSLDEVGHRVDEALKTVGMLHLKERPPYRLSGGEKRAVAIAAVLAMEPKILVMDEPSANLDPKTRRRLINLLKDFSHTKIIATHDLDLAVDLCERTIVIHEGRVAADAPTIEIMQDDTLLYRCSLERPLAMQGCPVCSPKTSV